MRPDKASTTPSNPERTRLHITPFNASLLTTIINPSLLPSASNISYHTLQTFPEADYGYIELPSAEAKKLQSKLQGSILRGRKVRVEPALSPKWAARVGSEEEGLDSNSKHDTGSRVDLSHRGGDRYHVLSGVLLENRRVQRGWARSAFSAKQAAGRVMGDVKGSTKPTGNVKAQCLFRTQLPPNAVPLEDIAKTKVGQKRRRSKECRETVVREFSSTTKYPTFLKENNQVSGKKRVSEYVDGKGWVDEDGNVVEAVARRQNRRLRHVNLAVKSQGADDGNEDHSSREHDDPEVTGDPKAGSAMVETESNTSSSEEEEISASEAEDPTSPQEATKKPKVAKALRASQAPIPHKQPQDTSQPLVSPRGNKSLTITIPPNPNNFTPLKTSDGKDVHPLEAIFKKPAMPGSTTSVPNITVDTERPFSFFDADPGITTFENQMPQTPFTQQDFQLRGIRSAAPTPDTAAPGKGFSFFGADDEVEEEEEEGEESNDVEEQDDQLPEAHASPSATIGDDVVSGGLSGEKGFEELFWERRGDTNRAWKRRRRETGKFKRKMENKRLAKRNV